MKELLKLQGAYNYWANQRIVETVLALPEGECLRELSSSFPSLQKTLLHIWDAETGWWQRLKLQERIELPGKTFNGTIQDVAAGLLHQSKLWEDWARQASPVAVDHVIQFYTKFWQKFCFFGCNFEPIYFYGLFYSFHIASVF